MSATKDVLPVPSHYGEIGSLTAGNTACNFFTIPIKLDWVLVTAFNSDPMKLAIRKNRCDYSYDSVLRFSTRS